MANGYDNTNSGALFRNEDKNAEGSNPNWPDYKGTINVNGQEFWLSAWLKEGKPGSKQAGKRFFSLSVKPKEDRAAQPRAERVARPQPVPIADEDVPF